MVLGPFSLRSLPLGPSGAPCWSRPEASLVVVYVEQETAGGCGYVPDAEWKLLCQSPEIAQLGG